MKKIKELPDLHNFQTIEDCFGLASLHGPRFTSTWGGSSSYSESLDSLQRVAEYHKLWLPEFQGKVRPLTYRENIWVLTELYEKTEKLCQMNFSTSSAIAYKGETTKFKLVSFSQELLDQTVHGERYISIDYDLIDGEEFDLDTPNLQERVNLELLEGDENLSKRFSKILSEKSSSSRLKFKPFQEPPKKDSLWPLQVILDFKKANYGIYFLSYGVSFLGTVDLEQYDNYLACRGLGRF